MRFTPFKNFVTLRNNNMLIKEALPRKPPIKVGNNRMSNYQNKKLYK